VWNEAKWCTRLSLNRPTFKMEMWKEAVKMRDLGIRIREDEVYDGSLRMW
jgi:hypothetical protein